MSAVLGKKLGECWGIRSRGITYYSSKVLITQTPPQSYNRCRVRLLISDTLDWKNGGLITTRKNKLGDGVIELASKSLISFHMKYKPLIYSGMRGANIPLGRNQEPQNPLQGPEGSEKKFDLLIQDLW